MNYFEFYGIQPGLLIDLKELKRKFLESSRLYHPDHFVLETDSSQAHAEDQSALNNKAYKTLSDQDLRIKYVLELKGWLKEEEVLTLDPEFLMEMMDINDLIVEDPGQAKVTLNRIEQELMEGIRPTFESFDFEQAADTTMKDIKEYYYKRRYILRLMDNLNKFAPDQSL